MSFRKFVRNLRSLKGREGGGECRVCYCCGGVVKYFMLFYVWVIVDGFGKMGYFILFVK